jgi:hypothetical protein
MKGLPVFNFILTLKICKSVIPLSASGLNVPNFAIALHASATARIRIRRFHKTITFLNHKKKTKLNNLFIASSCNRKKFKNLCFEIFLYFRDHALFFNNFLSFTQFLYVEYSMAFPKILFLSIMK